MIWQVILCTICITTVDKNLLYLPFLRIDYKITNALNIEKGNLFLIFSILISESEFISRHIKILSRTHDLAILGTCEVRVYCHIIF